MMELYEFAYLDESKVRMLVAGIDKGRVITSKTTKAAKSNKGGKGGINTPVLKLEGGAASADELMEEVSTEATAEGAFYRLRDFLSSGGETKLYSKSIDSVSIEDIKRGEIIELDGMIEVSPANELVSNLLHFLDAGSKLGFIDTSVAKDRQSMEAIKAVLDANRLSVVMSADEDKMKALAVLETSESLLRIPIMELNDEFIILGKVTRIIKKGETLDLTSFCMNPAFRKNKVLLKIITESLPKVKEALGGSADLSELILKGPVIVLSPIAIYR